MHGICYLKMKMRCVSFEGIVEERVASQLRIMAPFKASQLVEGGDHAGMQSSSGCHMI